MKNVISIVALVFFAISCGNHDSGHKASTDLVHIEASADSNNNTTKSTGVPQITFEKTVHDFGTITEGEVVEYEFRFKNNGDADLLIASAQGSCGCTVADFPKEPIAPGQSQAIKVKFNSEKRLDRFDKIVTVLSNTQPTENILHVTGLVKARPGSGN